MVITEFTTMGNPCLARVAERVTEFNTAELDSLVEDLFDTMHNLTGAGLAAPQIGVSKQVIVFGFEKNPRYPYAPPVPMTVLINPIVTPLTDEKEPGWEGCVSVPKLRGVVSRYKKIRYTGVDQYNHPIDRVVEGFHARLVQHETDHVNGILFPERLDNPKLFGFEENVWEYAKENRIPEL